MDLALNNLRRLKCHKSQPTNEPKPAVYNQDTIERSTKGCIPPFCAKSDFEITKSYRDLIFTFLEGKV